MNEAKPKRRWFRFSLRTLFALVTLCALLSCWTVYQLNWIRQRHLALDWLEQHWVSVRFNGGNKPPLALRFFGEPNTPDMTIRLDEHEDGQKLLEARRLFPECNFQPEIYYVSDH
jgi:hypothetical protein